MCSPVHAEEARERSSLGPPLNASCIWCSLWLYVYWWVSQLSGPIFLHWTHPSRAKSIWHKKRPSDASAAPYCWTGQGRKKSWRSCSQFWAMTFSVGSIICSSISLLKLPINILPFSFLQRVNPLPGAVQRSSISNSHKCILDSCSLYFSN